MNGLSERSFELVRRFVHDNAAISLAHDKAYLVHARLSKLAMRENIDSLEDLVAKLEDPSEKHLQVKMVESMTTNETSFYRDAGSFEALREHVLPEIAERSTGSINIMCAACSSGQEPYSLLMLIAEHLPHLLPRVKILAVDISSEMVERTRSGTYSDLEVNRGLPQELRSRYLDRKADRWVVKPALRACLETRVQNIARAWPNATPPMDLVFVRNVLIYFDMPTKKRVLQEAGRALKPGGYLILGGSESPLNVDDSYERVRLGRSAFFRRA